APDDALVLGGGAAATLPASGGDRFAAIREAATELFESGDVHAGTEAARPRVFGGFAFHEGACDGDPWGPFPEARFVLPRVQLTIADNGAWLTVNAVGPDADVSAVEDRLAREVDRFAALDRRDSADAADAGRPPRPGISESRRTTSREAWPESVGAAADRIRDGDLRKVVLAQALEADLAADFPRAAPLERLAEKYPDCHRYWFEPDGGESAFFGATPERLVSLRGRTVETDALATLFAGVGIVSDSDPDREWDEVQLKYRPILDELEGDGAGE
ncbi:isochorismate synthase, partial [Halorubrum distributum]